jgi:hypothetical protein
LHPELRALGFLKPQAEHISRSVEPDPKHEITRPPLDAAALTDLQHQGVEEHDGIDVIQRPLLPRAGVIHDRVGDAADQVAPDLHAIDLGDMRLNIAGREAAGVKREDLVVKPLKTPLTLVDDLRREAPIAIPGRVDRHLTVLGDQPLRHAPIARVPRSARRLLVALIAEVVGDLDLHRALHQPLGQLAKQPARPDDLLLRRRTGQQLVDHLIRERSSDVIRHPTQDPRRGRRRLA